MKKKNKQKSCLAKLKKVIQYIREHSIKIDDKLYVWQLLDYDKPLFQISRSRDIILFLEWAKIVTNLGFLLSGFSNPKLKEILLEQIPYQRRRFRSAISIHLLDEVKLNNLAEKLSTAKKAIIVPTIQLS